MRGYTSGCRRLWCYWVVFRFSIYFTTTLSPTCSTSLLLPLCSRGTSRQESPSGQTLMTLTPSRKLEELPKDDTHSIWGAWREITYPGSRPNRKASTRVEEFAEKTGGAWRTRYLGLFPANVSDSSWTTRCVVRWIPTRPPVVSNERPQDMHYFGFQLLPPSISEFLCARHPSTWWWTSGYPSSMLLSIVWNDGDYDNSVTPSRSCTP